MATITATKITESGIASSMTTCATGAGGDEFVNTGQEFIRVKQGSFNNTSNKVKVFYKAGTGLTDAAFDALTDIAGAHLLKIEVLYL